MRSYSFDITPVAKPRMTQKDKWNVRPATTRYWSYKKELLLLANKQAFVMPEHNYHLFFYLPMPKSWSSAKKQLHRLSRHQQKPDKDNLEKGFLDALLPDDSKVWDGRVTKLWDDEGRIEIVTDV